MMEKLTRRLGICAAIVAAVLALLTVHSCIDPLDVDTQERRKLLVVEGGITTTPGPHKVVLSKSDKYGDVLDGFVRKQTGATVWIRDDQGNQLFLQEKDPGEYFTPDGFQAVPGRRYTLFITLDNGERYVSLPAFVPEAPPIDTLLIQFKRLPALIDESLNTGLEVYARWQDPAGVPNFYLWQAEGVYVLNTHPELHEAKDGQGNPVPAPKDCCDRCYVYEYDLNSELRLFRDNFTDGKLTTELAAFIPDDGKRFMEKYMVVVKQYSLSKEAYQFYDLLRSQLSIQGTIFDPPPATIGGNIINLDNPDESVIGFFVAASVSTDTLFIRRSDVEEPRAIKQINDDCRVFENSTTQVPPFWK